MNVNDSVKQFGLRATTMEEFIKKQVRLLRKIGLAG